MIPDYILLRFGELTLKGKNRFRFENSVITQVRKVLYAYPQTQITKSFGRVYIELNGAPFELISLQLKKVFGLISFSPVLKTELDLHSIRQAAIKVMAGLHVKPKTFKVSSRRPYKEFMYDSNELNNLVGGYVLEHFSELQVNVHQPEIELRIEIREQGAFVFSDMIPGLGGFPSGSNGKAMLMLSGGIDSPTAGWLAMRKGLRIEAVHFYSFPYTSERAKQKVIDLTRILAGFTQEIKLHLVPFTEIQTKLNQDGQDKLMITLMRRAMFRITEKLAIQEEAKAIVTGESLGQVASQTLSSLDVIGRVVSMPILRPLITMDKREIVSIAEQIGTYPISILPYDDCCTLFLPKSPSTNPNQRIVEKFEHSMQWLSESIASAVNQTEVITLSQKDQTEEDALF
jgi:thiamine biosynthesis protein ThiI